MTELALADTSVWIAHFRGHDPASRALAASTHIVTCGPVVAELMHGLDEERGAELWPHMAGLPWVELDRDGWRQVGVTAAALRRAGTPTGLTDIQIAVCARESGATLLTSDRDFVRVAKSLDGLAVKLLPDRS